MSDAIRRGIRTYLDSLIGSFTVLWLSSGIGADGTLPGVADLSVIGKLGLAAVISSVPMALSIVKNSLEDHGKIPAILKAPASDGVAPVPSGEEI